MALKWGFGKKPDDEQPDEAPEGKAQVETGEEEGSEMGDEAPSKESEVVEETAASDDGARVLIHGDGFAAPLWMKRLAAMDIEFHRTADLTPDVLESMPFEIIIDTDLGAPTNSINVPKLTETGLILAPCYADSATIRAAEINDLAHRVVGYALWPPANEAAAEAPTIELARALQTSDEAWERALEIASALSFTAETVGDIPGLVFGRVLACLINEATYALSDKIASEEDIDSALKLGVNYPRGMFEWADDIGLDLILEILEGLQAHYGEDRYRPAPLMRQMVVAGRGFYA